jgi:predicted transcriptional regulator
MDATNYRLLQQVVARYDERNQPVTAASLADAVDSDVPDVTDRLARLEDCELLASEGAGVRPTVTGRELLELDIDDPEFFVIDSGRDC